MKDVTEIKNATVRARYWWLNWCHSDYYFCDEHWHGMSAGDKQTLRIIADSQENVGKHECDECRAEQELPF